MMSFVSASRMDVATGSGSNNDDSQYQSQDEYTIHGGDSEKNGDHDGRRGEQDKEKDEEENDITPTITPSTQPTATATAT